MGPPPAVAPASPPSAISPTSGPGPGTPLLLGSSTANNAAGGSLSRDSSGSSLDGGGGGRRRPKRASSSLTADGKEDRWGDEGSDEEDAGGQSDHPQQQQQPPAQQQEQRQRRRRLWFGIGLGQALSILIAFTGVFSSLLARDGASRPTTQSALTYVFLSLYLIRRPGGPRAPLRVPWWRYALLAVVDVEANFFVVLAYRYTAITSIMLLDCFSIPVAMLLSRLFLRSRYRPLHLAGVALCIAGLCLTVLSDRIVPSKDTNNNNDDSDGYPHALLGDMLCLVGAALYAASNVMQEALVKAHDRAEFLGMLGAYGAALSFMQAVILEWLGPQWRHEAQEPGAEGHWARDTLYTLGFAVTLALMYSLTAYFLTEADATLFNLSLLTSDGYALLYRYTVLKQTVSWLYGVALGCTFCGLLVYNAPPAVNQQMIRGGGGGGGGGIGLDDDPSGYMVEEGEEMGGGGSIISFHPEVCLSHDGSGVIDVGGEAAAGGGPRVFNSLYGDEEEAAAGGGASA